MSDSNSPVDDEQLVRLFPLDGVVLFPYGLLPLHIFEPRYRQMTEDALATNRSFAMILPKASLETEPVPLHAVGCVGRIHHEERLPDGRFHLVLCGESRIRIEREVPTDRLYRIAQVRLLKDQASEKLQSRRRLQRSQITSALGSLLEKGNPNLQQFLDYLQYQCRSSAFADLVAYAAPIAVKDKQSLLETTDVDARLDMLVSFLSRSVDVGRATTFPPVFSTN